MNEPFLKTENSQSQNSHNASSLNYSLLMNKINEEDRLSSIQEIEKNKKIDNASAFKSVNDQKVKQKSPIASQLKSMGFSEFRQQIIKHQETLQMPFGSQKKGSKLTASIVKEKQSIQSHISQIHDQSLIMKDETESDNNSHFIEASISDSMDDIFNPPVKKQQNLNLQYNKASSSQNLANSLQGKLCINVIDTTMKVSDKHVFPQHEKGVKNNPTTTESAPASGMLVSRTSTIRVGQHQNLFKGLASQTQKNSKHSKQLNKYQQISEEQNDILSSKKNYTQNVGNNNQSKVVQPSIKNVSKQKSSQRQSNLPQKVQNILTKLTNQIQIPNRMTSTYNQKIEKQFDMNLNQGNFSEPDEHNLKKSSARQQSKKIEDFQENLFEQEKKNAIKQEIIQKIENIEKTFNSIRQNERDRFKNPSLTQKGHVDFIKMENEGRKPQRTVPMKDFSIFEEMMQDKPSYHNVQYINHHNEAQRSILNELRQLKQKLAYIEQQTSRTMVKQDNQKHFKKGQKIKASQIKYKKPNKVTVKDYVQSKPSKNHINSSLLTSQDFVNMQNLLHHFRYQIVKQTQVNQIVQMCFEIIQLFSLHIDNRCQIGLVLFNDCVQLQFQEIGIVIIWKYGGQFYIGTCKQSPEQMKERNGQGIQLLKNGYIYKGNFAKNKKNGFGMIFHTSGERYKGKWANNVYEGKGTIIDNQSIYEGYFLKGMKSKQGIQKFISGDVYEGQFSKDKFNGKGRYTWSNSTYYTGNFVDGQMHGYGYWRSKQGDKYEGNYLKNMKHGNGVYVSKTGKILRGKFQFGIFIEHQSKRSVIKQEDQLQIDDQYAQDHNRQAGNIDNLKGRHYKIIVQEFANKRSSNKNQN